MPVVAGLMIKKSRTQHDIKILKMWVRCDHHFSVVRSPDPITITTTKAKRKDSQVRRGTFIVE